MFSVLYPYAREMTMPSWFFFQSILKIPLIKSYLAFIRWEFKNLCLVCALSMSSVNNISVVVLTEFIHSLNLMHA